MFALRCAVVLLALLGCTQAEKCTTTTYDLKTPYYVPFGKTYSYEKTFLVKVPVDQSQCQDVVGSKVTVCVNDQRRTLTDSAAPNVDLYQLDEALVQRYRANGRATVYSGVYCSYRPPHTGPIPPPPMAIPTSRL